MNEEEIIKEMDYLKGTKVFSDERLILAIQNIFNMPEKDVLPIFKKWKARHN